MCFLREPRVLLPPRRDGPTIIGSNTAGPQTGLSLCGSKAISSKLVVLATIELTHFMPNTSRINLEQLEKLFCDELGDALHFENMLLKALPKFEHAASNPDLKALFSNHVVETKGQIVRLGKIFALLDLPAREKKCEGMMGILVECQHLVSRWKPSVVTDQGLISAARKIKYFEIVAYDSLARWAQISGHAAITELAREGLAEEKAMGEELEKMAECALSERTFRTA